MKLQKLLKADPVERLSLSIHLSTLNQLTAYKEYYEATYGEQIPQARLVEEMLKAFMAQDKEFLKRLADKQAE